jgi:hypothetical protein
MMSSTDKSTTVLLAAMAVLAFSLSGCTDTQSSRPDKPIIELNTDRPGSDISTIALDQPKATLCHNACLSNSGCVAWTYVKPGIINAKAHCRLKSTIPEPKRSSCCVSGRK